MGTEHKPVIDETTEAELEPQPATESAGGVRPPGRIGSGLRDDDEGGDPPDDAPPPATPTGGWSNVSIEDLSLSFRGHMVLRRHGILTVGDILEKSEHQLLSLQNFGRKSYRELRQRLDELGVVAVDAAWDKARRN